MTKKRQGAGPSGKRYDWTGVLQMIASGATLAQIARKVGCNPESVHTWAKRRGLVVRRHAVATTDERYGCTNAEARALNGGVPLNRPGHPASHYRDAWRSAAKRGIGWEFTFPTWLQVWNDAGGLHLRGQRPTDLCMARNGDKGPYSVGNVQIKTTRDNVLESFENIVRRKPALKAVGLGRGWTYVPRQTTNPYLVQICNTFVGCYPDESSARGAYLDAACRINSARGVAPKAHVTAKA